MADEIRGHNFDSLRRMEESFADCLEVATVSQLSDRRIIFVEDGNHGENRPRQDEFSSSGIAFIRPPDLKDGRVDFTTCGRINDAGFGRVRKGIGRRGDIILTHRATVGRIAMTRDDAPDVFVTNPGTTIWRSTDLNVLDQRYLYCFMRSAAFMDQLWSQVGNNCTFDYVSLTQQRGLRIAFPPLPEQRAIACILGALDDKIELNRRRNGTLEAMARAIFQSWFVDFDPVKAKAAGRTPPGLAKDLAALFPDRFEDSPLGPIPKGWRVGTLADVAELVLGGDWGKDASSEETPAAAFCIRGADIPSLQSGGIGNMPIRYLKRASLEKRALRDGDLVIEISGGSPTQSTGRPVLILSGLLARLEHSLTCSNFCRLFRPNTSFYPEYLYLLLRTLYDADMFLQYENGTTGIKNFAFSHFSSAHKLLLASEMVLKEFSRTIKPFFIRRQRLGQESHVLAALRDALLPKLISGELRVPDAERIVGRAV